MEYKMYLLDIHDLEDKSLAQEALALIDDRRRAIVDKYCKEKDRLRAIAAGLLLQIGFLELEPEETRCEKIDIFTDSPTADFKGICCKWKAEELVKYLQEFSLVPIPLVYQNGVHGKPFWVREALETSFSFKRLWHFNLSHSGRYVVLAVADTKVGIDIQEPRKVDRFPGGFQAFSRMEAYVKCTGEGYAIGYETYKRYQGNISGYEIQSVDIIEQYALNMCFAVEESADS